MRLPTKLGPLLWRNLRNGMWVPVRGRVSERIRLQVGEVSKEVDEVGN